MKKILVVLALIVVAALGYVLYDNSRMADTTDNIPPGSHGNATTTPNPNGSTSVSSNDVQFVGPKNATYVIDGQSVTLKNGLSEVPAAPNSALKITTRYFGNEVRRDFDGDGLEDVAFLVTQQTGGTGTFYYVVAALQKENPSPVGSIEHENPPTHYYVGSHGFLLGDRIAPQTTNLRNRASATKTAAEDKVIVVNYADRKPGEGFATPPSVGKSVWLLLDPKTMQFGEVEQDFSGETDPARMSLTSQERYWLSTMEANKTIVMPRIENQTRFTLEFKTDKTFSARTDCNGMGGSYRASSLKEKGTLTFSEMFSTQMYCEGSQESIYSGMLAKVKGFHFTGRGELILELNDGGVMTFM